MNDTEFNPKRILCVSAHPDDNEFCYGGSLAKWIKNGAEVKYLICSDGSKGSKDNMDAQQVTNTRKAEQESACAVIGVQQFEVLGYEDGTLHNSLDALRKDIVKAIRAFKPDTVICMDPTFVYSTDFDYVNHIDHRSVGQATIDAVYPIARDALYYPELLEEGLQPHKTGTLLMTNLDRANLYVDISEHFDTKVDALCAHTSQMPDRDGIGRFLHHIADEMGGRAECELAEGFVKISLDTSE